jgi:branched-chain amino acid transport system permease protein
MSASLINGLFLGLVYSLFACGIVLVYRVDRVVNFAHGNIGMIGTLVFASMWAKDHHPLWLAIVAGCLVSMVIATLTSFLVTRPLRGVRPEIPTLATFGVGALLLVYGGRRWGVNPIRNPPLIEGISFKWAGVYVQKIQVLTAVTVVVLVALLLLVLTRTPFGLRVRAVALNPGAASQVGIRTDWVSMSIWAISGLLAALAGIFVSSRGALTYSFMTGFMLRGLIVALLGGLTNLSGAFIGGIFLGLVEGFVGYQFTEPGAQEAFLAVLIIVVLMARPMGLLRAQY